MARGYDWYRKSFPDRNGALVYARMHRKAGYRATIKETREHRPGYGLARVPVYTVTVER